MMTLRVSTLGRIDWVAKSHCICLVCTSWAAPTMPLTWVPMRLRTVWAASKADETDMIATSAKLRAAALALGCSAVIPRKKANTAVKTLKIAPTSKPSITPRPTAKPARTAFKTRLGIEGLSRAAMANTFMDQASGQVGRPQQAGEKAVELSAAASPASKPTQDRKRSWRKRHQVLKPRINKPTGA